MLLTKDQILAAPDLKTIDLYIPEWGGTVRISTMMGTAKDRYENSLLTAKNVLNRENMRAKLVANCIVNEHGELIFTPEDIEKLGRKSCSALDKVFIEAQKLNAQTNEDIEELAKNSSADLSDDSASN